MPRRPRVIIPGVPHHLTQRGNNRQPVFHGPGDCRRYLDLLSLLAPRYGTRILGYCLMPNHVHLIAVPEQERSLARTLGRVHSEYALALNRERDCCGHVWQSRFFSCPMDGRHLLTAMSYVDLNPVRANLATAAWEWPWSSARAHTKDSAMDAVLDYRWAGHFGGWDFAEWREILAARMSEGESDAVRRATRTGEPLGSPEFVSGLERRTGRRLRVWARGRPKRPQGSEAGGGCV